MGYGGFEDPAKGDPPHNPSEPTLIKDPGKKCGGLSSVLAFFCSGFLDIGVEDRQPYDAMQPRETQIA